jgi:hypothetical protein
VNEEKLADEMSPNEFNMKFPEIEKPSDPTFAEIEDMFPPKKFPKES